MNRSSATQPRVGGEGGEGHFLYTCIYRRAAELGNAGLVPVTPIFQEVDVCTLDCLIIGGLNVRFLAGDRLQIVVIRYRNLSVYSNLSY
jgi:hypothetical protein